MKTLMTFVFLFAIATQTVSQDVNESERIKELLSELDKRALDAKLQFDQLLSTYSKQHPKVKQYETQLKSISEAKAELASKLALIELSDAQKELKKHASLLSKQLEDIKSMMSAKVDDEFKSEYKKLHDQASKVFQQIQERVDQKHKDVARGLNDLFSKSNVDPAKMAKEYDRAMFDSLSKALAQRRDQALIQLQEARIAREKSESINKDLQSRINDLEQRLAKEKQSADQKQGSAQLQKKHIEKTLSAFDDVLGIADLKLKRFSADQMKMDSAIDKAKSFRLATRDDQVKKLDELYIKLADVKSHSEKTTKTVEDRLKKVEADVGQIKSMLEQLIEKIK